MYSFNAGVVVQTAALRDGLDAVLGKTRVRVVVDREQIGDVDTLAQHRVDVLIVECKDLKVPLDRLVAQLKQNSISPLLIALSDSARPELILAAMRSGFHEFFYPPFEEVLARTLAGRLANKRGRQGRVVGVFSAKGGCGATTVACHLARELVRQTESEVLLADFDWNSPMVQFLMKTTSAYSLADAFANLDRLDASYWRALVSPVGSRFDVITATGEFPPLDAIATVLEFARSQYDWTVLDLGRQMPNLPDLDHVLLVSTPDPLARHRVFEITAKREVRLLVRGGDLRDESEALSEAYSEGRLLAASSRANRQFAALAREIAGITEPVTASLIGLLRRKVSEGIHR